MAIASGAIFEVRATGSDSNGGFFVPGTSGTVDYSQQDSPQLSVTDGVANGTTTITSATGGFTAAMVNNGINIGGSLYQITAVGSATSITVDRTVATASALAMNVGGALAMLSYAQAQGGLHGWLNGALNETNAVANSLQAQCWVGYGTTRGDNIKASISLTAVNAIGLSCAARYNVFVNISVNGNNNAGTIGANIGNFNNFGADFYNCDFVNCATGINTSERVTLTKCFVAGCPTIQSGGTNFVNSVIKDISSASMVNCNCERCILIGSISGSYVSPNTSASTPLRFRNNVVYSTVANTGTGYAPAYGFSSNDPFVDIDNNIFCNLNTGININGSGNALFTQLNTNAFYGTTTPVSNGTPSAPINNSSQVNLTAGPFVNPTMTINSWSDAQAAFALNDVAGGGALCRGAGTPQYLDIGAVQSAPSGGGGIIIPGRGFRRGL